MAFLRRRALGPRADPPAPTVGLGIRVVSHIHSHRRSLVFPSFDAIFHSQGDEHLRLHILPKQLEQDNELKIAK